MPSGGATDLGAAISAAAALLDPTRQGAVVYVGDAAPTVGELAAEGLLRRMDRLPNPVRLYGVGVGATANLDLLAALTRGGGLALRVEDRSAAAEAALRILAHVGRPLAQRVTVELGPGIDNAFPRGPVDVVLGEVLSVVGRVRGDVPTTVTISGTVSGQEFSRELQVETKTLRDPTDLRLRWASERLRQLLLESAGREAVAELGTRCGLITPFTSYYVPSARELRESGHLSLIDRPLLLDGIERRGAGSKLARATVASVLTSISGPFALALAGCGGGESAGNSNQVAPTSLFGSPSAGSEPLSSSKAAPPQDESGGSTGEGGQGGKGKRHKGEEGQMGHRDARAKATAAEQRAEDTTTVPMARVGREQTEAEKVATDDEGERAQPPINNEPMDTMEHSGRSRNIDQLHALGYLDVDGAQRNAPNQPSSGLMVETSPEAAAVVTEEAGVKTIMGELRGSGDLEGPSPVSSDPDAQTAGSSGTLSSLDANRGGGDSSDQSDLWRVVTTVTTTVTTSVTGWDQKIHRPRRCSGASSQPLADRRALWQERLSKASSVAAWVRVYSGAIRLCEAPTWRDRRTLLNLLIARAGSVSRMLQVHDQLRSRGARQALRAAIFRRVRTPDDLRLVRNHFGVNAAVDWELIEQLLSRATTVDAQIRVLRQLIGLYPRTPGVSVVYPQSFDLRLRLLSALEEAGRLNEARRLAHELRTDPLADAGVRTAVGEMYLRLGDRAEARRVFSEIVEFAPYDAAARRRLGDLYRAHEWFEEAYRQYQTLAEIRPDDPTVSLLLAQAAAGAGRVDEAIRLEQSLAETAEPGASGGMARIAILWSSVRFSKLRQAAREASDSERLRALLARMRRSGVLREAGSLRISLTWSHPDAGLSLWVAHPGLGLTRPTDIAPEFGIEAFDIQEAESGRYQLEVRRQSRDMRTPVTAELVIVWNEGQSDEQILIRELRFEGDLRGVAWSLEGQTLTEATLSDAARREVRR